MVTNQSRKHPINHVPTDAPTHPRTHEHTRQAIHPPTTCNICAAMTYSSKSVSSSYAAPQLRVVKARRVQKKKLQNTSTTHTHEPVRTPTLPHTDRITNPHAPSVPPTTCYNNAAVRAAAHELVHAVSISVSWGDFHFFTILQHPGE